MGEDLRPRLAIAAPSAYVIGGVQTWLDYIVPGLEQKGWQVSVLMVHGTHSDAERYVRVHPFRSVQRVDNLTGTREGRVLALQKAIRRADARLVLCVNIVDAYEAVARERVRCGSGVRVISALHGLGACYYQDLLRWRNSIDGVIATNQLAAAAAVSYCGVDAGRVYYAPCGVEIHPFSWPASSDRQAHVLFAGRFDEEQKRVMDLPRIVRALESRDVPFTLRLAGAGPADSRLRAALANARSRVEFVGELSGDLLRTSFFRPDTVALVLSPRETGPLVAFEAMSCGVTLVTSRYQGIGLEGSLGHGQNCLVFEVGDVEGAADAIASLADPALRCRLAAAGHETIRKRYSRSASIQAWHDALTAIANSNAMPTSAQAVETRPAGRLDRLLGVAVAERARRLLGRSFAHVAPGDEWPHSYGTDDDPDFDAHVASLDLGVLSVR